MLVDGTHVRNRFDSDFSQGGNGYAYDFVPESEIWIDEQIDPVEWPFIAFHECEEAELMKQGMDYDRAHDRVKYLEDMFRRKLMGDRRARAATKKNSHRHSIASIMARYK
jgi:hypothetical protein